MVNLIWKWALVLLLTACAADPAAGQTIPDDPKILELLETATGDDHRLPGLVAAIQSKQKPIRIAAAGVRKVAADPAITNSDLMHLGSCTKALTATLAARLVEQGRLSWDTKLKEQLPKLAKRIHGDYGNVTLAQLLQHRGGMPADAKNWWLDTGETIQDRRLAIAAASLQDKPTTTPGSQFEYSNIGYMVVGVFIEKATAMSWEEAMQDGLFHPLGIETAGFGPPGTKGKVDQPWGHVLRGEKLFPIQHDNAPALGPAGTVHMCIADWARFAMLHVDGKVGEQTFLSAETLDRLHQPGPGQDYAMGWIVAERPWGQGRVLTHGGSNTMWMCTIWVAPKTGTAYLAATNVADGGAAGKVDQIIGQLISLDRG